MRNLIEQNKVLLKVLLDKKASLITAFYALSKTYFHTSYGNFHKNLALNVQSE